MQNLMLDLVVFFVSLFGEEARLLQLVLEGVHALFIGKRFVLKNFAGTKENNEFIQGLEEHKLFDESSGVLELHLGGKCILQSLRFLSPSDYM